MGCFVVKLVFEDECWYKLADHIENGEYEDINLDEAIAYDPNNTDSEQWFYVDAYNEKEGFLHLLDSDFDVAELESISRGQFEEYCMEFIAYYHNHRYYIQKFTKGNYLKRKWFAWNGDAVEYCEQDGLVLVNPMPHCIYDNQEHRMYFKDISKAYSVFNNLKLDYRTATDDETTQMLESDIIQAIGFDASNVGVSNRKRITSVFAKYNEYPQDKKEILKSYIRGKVGGNLPFDEATGKFVVNNDTQLRLLLYGIQQRLYQQPLEEETQVATASTGLSKIL